MLSGDLEEITSEGSGDEPVGTDEEAGSSPCIQIGRTYLSWNKRDIWGYGSVSCKGSSANLTIRRHRWNGWQDIVTKTVKYGQGDVYIGYDCTGTGTHDFITRIWGNGPAGDFHYKDSNTIRVTCP